MKSEINHQYANKLYFTIELYSEPQKTSKVECFAKIFNGWNLLPIFTKRSISDVWQGSEYVSALWHESSESIILYTTYTTSILYTFCVKMPEKKIPLLKANQFYILAL